MKKVKLVLISFVIIFGLFLKVGINNDLNNEVLLQANTVKDEREFKAVWMSTFTGEAPYHNEAQFKNDMSESLNVLEHYGLNALIFHVRTHNNAFYKSNLNPVASWWSSANFDEFDPLTWLIAETHKRGIEFHAWMNPYRVSTTYQRGTLPSSNPQSDPNNLIVEGDKTILNPALANVKQHIYNTIDEFTTMYPKVDAVHFDDYFYINTSAYPTNADTRRDHVTEMIEGVKNTLTTFNNNNNTSIQFGISPTGIYRNGDGEVTYDGNGNPKPSGSNTRGFEHYGPYLYADTVKWAVDGSIDYLLPQTYWARNHSTAPYEPLMNWWNDVFKNLNVNLYSGLGVYMANSTSGNGWADDMYELASQLSIIDGLNKVDGYSIYSFKHLENGYTGSTLKSGQQIRNAYDNSLKSNIKVLPKIRSMTPVNAGVVEGLSYINGTLSWQAANNAKFYYIYHSNNHLKGSSDEIIGVVGNGELSFDISEFGTGNYGVRALSSTNHLSELSSLVQVEIETYTIDYMLNNGEFNVNYESRDEMIIDFLTDFYEFLNPTVNLETFIHGVGNTSGFDGLYDSEEYFNELYNPNDKSIKPSTNKFINQTEYNKWVPLLDLIDEYVIKVNPDQSFWGSIWTGERRIKPFIQKYNYGKVEVDPLLNTIPLELQNEINVINEYNEATEVILPIPSKANYEFLGWYDNPSFEGSPYLKINVGSTGNKTFYAKWTLESSTNLVKALDGASIRTTGNQGLRFYAEISLEHKTNPHGFYLIYGKATKADLQYELNNSLNNNIYLNGKEVFQIEVPGVTNENMFNVVLTNIPLKGYLDSITVVPYIIIEGSTFLANEGVTRSVGEVALKGYKQEPSFSNIINDIDNNLYSFDKPSLTISKETIFSLDVNQLKEEFINDWNAKFNTTWTTLDASTFYESAKTGSTDNKRDNINLAGTNIYKFFNDSIYKDKWDWLLNYLKSIDTKVHPTRQVIALLGDGTNNTNDGASSRGVLFNGDHLSYSIVNFFNKTHEVGGYTAINFTIESNYETLKLFNNKILITSFDSKNYVLKNSVITLPEIDIQKEYFDGTNSYPSKSEYVISEEVTLTIRNIN